ncbi:unnamed protein product [Protopolystoma xenopodis]|uniref:Uncharacterized protein n=1 Tax=Protopolystoma xenopodis TaxID=117903 RepID=A0A3S5B7J6_9PLAT|nr:unnamed protein product [Protopolystoma xenopodis]
MLMTKRVAQAASVPEFEQISLGAELDYLLQRHSKERREADLIGCSRQRCSASSKPIHPFKQTGPTARTVMCISLDGQQSGHTTHSSPSTHLTQVGLEAIK